MAKLGFRQSFSRRGFLAGTIGFCATAPFLDGCGGSGAGGPQGFTFKGSATLPPGIKAANATVVSGLGSSSLTGGQFGLNALTAFPTMASILDSASGHVVMMGMLDPAKNSQALDAANCAATLIFLSLGGSQLPPNGRAPLFAHIQSSPTTATLAGVITTRLAADPLALVHGDSTIKTALAAAVAAVNAGHLTALRSSPSTVKPTFVVHGTVIEGSYQANPTVTGSSEPVIAINETLRETQLSVFYVGSRDNNGVRTDLQNAQSLLSFKEVPRAVSDAAGHLLYGQYSFTIAPQSTGKNADFFGLVRLTPIFDAPDPAFFTDSRYSSNVAVWRVVLEDMYARAQAQVVSEYILEAMGMGCITNTALLQNAVKTFSAIGSSEQGLFATARKGTGLKASTLQFLLNATSSDPAAQAYINAVQSAFGLALPENGAIRLQNLRGNVLIFQAIGALDTSIQLGELNQSLTEKEDSFANPVAIGFLNEAEYAFSGLLITPATAQYQPGMDLTLSIPSSYNDVPFTIEWSLNGTNAILDDGLGHSGTDIKTNATSVTLKTTPSTAGTLKVTCNVILKSSGNVVETATSTITQIVTSGSGSITLTAVQNAGIDPNIGVVTLYGSPPQSSITLPNNLNNYKFGITFGGTVFGKYPGSATVKGNVFTYATGNNAVSIIVSTPGKTTFTKGEVITIPANGVVVGEVASQAAAQLTITSVNGKLCGFSLDCLLYNPGDTTFSPDATFQFHATGTFLVP